MIIVNAGYKLKQFMQEQYKQLLMLVYMDQNTSVLVMMTRKEAKRHD